MSHHAEDAVRACLPAGAHDVASRLLEDVQVSATRYRHGLLAARAVLAESQEQTEEALRLYAEVARRWAEFGFVLGGAHALLGEARCLSTLGDPDRAGEKLATARGLFERLGARSVLAEADAEIGSAAMPPA